LDDPISTVLHDPIRLGIVGGGLVTQVAHLPALRALDSCFRIEALAEPSAPVRDGLAARYGIPRTHARHEALLDAGGLDALLVCSPNGTHAQVVLDALDAGVHVLVEKPLCLTERAARAIAARAAATGAVVQVGYMKRFDPAYEALLDHLPAPGDLRLITTTTVDPEIGSRLRPRGFIAPADGTVPAETAAQVAEAVGSDDPRHVAPFSGAFLGALIHDVNLVLGLLDAMGIAAGEVTDAIGGADGSLAYGAIDLGDGARWTAAWMLLPDAGPFREDVRVFAADGVRALGFPAPYHAGAATVLRIDGDPARTWRAVADSYARELEHFHACIADGAACRTPAEQSVRDIALLTRLYRAAVAA
jgi:predicted dehydrogenase